MVESIYTFSNSKVYYVICPEMEPRRGVVLENKIRNLEDVFCRQCIEEMVRGVKRTQRATCIMGFNFIVIVHEGTDLIAISVLIDHGNAFIPICD